MHPLTYFLCWNTTYEKHIRMSVHVWYLHEKWFCKKNKKKDFGMNFVRLKFHIEEL
jgi:hypothetical protein